MENFRSPYFASSIREFWSRWHISLSTWFRDYVYIPLGGNRKHHYINLMITFIISGLWHGANWTFIAWGAVQGAESNGSRVYFANMFNGVGNLLKYLRQGFVDINMSRGQLGSELIMLFIVGLCDYVRISGITINLNNRFVRWSMYIALGLVVILSSRKGVANEFVYFQF